MELFSRAKEAALQVLCLDDTLAEAHTPLGIMMAYRERDRWAAEHMFRGAIRLQPGYATAHLWYASILMRMYEGRLDEARREISCALDLDPFSPAANIALAELHIHLGEPDAAVDTLLKSVKQAPRFPMAWIWLGLAYGESGRYSKASAALERFKELPGLGSPWRTR